jgi:hypothetical protein
VETQIQRLENIRRLGLAAFDALERNASLEARDLMVALGKLIDSALSAAKEH